MKRVVIVSFSDTKSDPRVLRQILALKGICNLTVYGFGQAPKDLASFVPFSTEQPNGKYSWISKVMDAFLLFMRFYSVYYWRNPRVMSAQATGLRDDADVYIANDFETLPLALSVAPNTSRVLLDAHEYTPDEIPREKWYRPLLQGYLANWLVKKHIQRIDGMMTVSPGIADAYQRAYSIERPDVVMNTPSFQNLSATTPKRGKIRLIHHGAATPTRRVDLLIALISELDERFELNLMLVESDANYMSSLVVAAERSPRSRDIHFHKPVNTEEISSYINQFDIGIFLYPHATKNEEFTLPNKFFEFIQARLAIAIGPSPEMMAVVDKHELGIVASDFTSGGLANKLNQLTVQQVSEFKRNSSVAAATLSWDNQERKFLDLAGL